MIRTLVVDDEPLAREGLRGFLADAGGVELVGECGDGDEAVRRLREGDVDLLFLDVQMPELDGFEVLARVGAEGPLPAVVFVTAYDRYALRAFEVHAVDYLLKPVERERFMEALERARDRIGRETDDGAARRLRALLEAVAGRGAVPDRLLVRGDGRAWFVEYGSIDRVEAQGNYVLLHVGSEKHLMRDTMARMEEELEPRGFARIHRSHIVNLARVAEIQPWFKGDHLVILEDGTRLSLTRRYRPALEARLGRRI